MPGQLKHSACCPVCGEPLAFLVDLSSPSLGRVMRQFYHDRIAGALRRRRPCRKTYRDHEQAQRERQALEVRAA